jgi:hypothetical protein
MLGLVVLESPWENSLDSPLSVGPFLIGLRNALHIKVATQQFNGAHDLRFFLREFSRRSSSFSHCYIACHGTRGRLQPLLADVNSTTIAHASRGSRGRGFIIGACAFGNTRTARNFLRQSGANFVAGYGGDVPWMESMIVDLLFLSYLFAGRCRASLNGKREQLLIRGDGDFALMRSQNPLKVARWVYEDLPLARKLGFVVHRRRPGMGRAIVDTYPRPA